MYIESLRKNNQRGVSLIEVLIALLVIAVGVLGLSKMQALAVSNTQVSGLRGLVALQAASLAALMHSDKGYWQVPLGTAVYCSGTASCVLTGTSTSAFGAVPTTCLYPTLCLSSPSGSPADAAMVASDMTNWMAQMNANVPGYTATIDCSGTLTLPVVCSIEIVWLEKQAGGGTTTASLAAATPSVTQAYYLYVQP